LGFLDGFVLGGLEEEALDFLIIAVFVQLLGDRDIRRRSELRVSFR